jgi:hypothetical protein
VAPPFFTTLAEKESSFFFLKFGNPISGKQRLNLTKIKHDIPVVFSFLGMQFEIGFRRQIAWKRGDG